MDLFIAGGRGLGLTIPDHHATAALVAARSVPSTASRAGQAGIAQQTAQGLAADVDLLVLGQQARRGGSH